VDELNVPSFAQKLSLALSAILLVTYALSLVFSLKTHREFFASTGGAEHGEAPWPLAFSLVTLAVATVLIALVSEVFVASVQHAALSFGMSEGLRRFHRRRAGGRRRRNGVGLLGRAQKPPGHERGHSPWAARRRSPFLWRRCLVMLSYACRAGANGPRLRRRAGADGAAARL
jgi:hypothetical protein